MTILDQKEKRLPGIDLVLHESKRKPSAHHPSGFVVEFLLRGNPDKDPQYGMSQEELFEKLVRLLANGTRVYVDDDLPIQLTRVLREDNERLTKENEELQKKLNKAAAELQHWGELTRKLEE